MIVQGENFPVKTGNMMNVDTITKFSSSAISAEKFKVNNNTDALSTTSFYLTKEVHSIDDEFDSEYDEEVDEEFSEDEFLQEEQQAAPENDVTQQLLNFAEAVNSDIQRFFGRKAEDEDSCDIYQDKWTSGKSGRELYYAELLKIAQGGDTGENEQKSKTDTSKNKHDSSKSKQYSGKMNVKIGVGPLAELFEYGLRNYISDKNSNCAAGHKRFKTDVTKYEHLVPMADRKLPRSFWKEPGNEDTAVGKNGVVDPPKVIDFSDLIVSLNSNSENSEEYVNDVATELGL